MSRPTFQIHAERSGAWWLLTSPDAPGAVSQVRRLNQVDEHMREAIAFVMDVDADSFDLDIVPELPTALAEEVRAARAAIEQAAEVARAAAERQRKIVQELVITQRLTGREIAMVLGVSPQRVSQLSVGTSATAKQSSESEHAERKVPKVQVPGAKRKQAATVRQVKRTVAAKAATRSVAARGARKSPH